tara:strand:+ start:349 stop:1125 length:777 start_codon:yes stop_codon:yes gene_type:complete
MKLLNIRWVTLLAPVLLFSCASKKNILYLQDIENYSNTTSSSKNQIRFKKNDEITINVSSSDKKSAIPFNLPLVSNANNNQINLQQTIQPYLVDENGDIQFPILGKIHVLGLTRNELNDLLKERIEEYVKSPIINIRITNFSVSVLGEVRKPGVYRINNERVTLLEALSLAGDLSIYAERKEIILIREDKDYNKVYFKINITESKLFDSDYYYLQQNDAIVVSPNRAQVQSSAFNRNTPIYVSIASLLLSVLTIFALN